MKEKAIKLAQNEMTLSGRDVVVTNVVPSEHPLACEIWTDDGNMVEVSGLIAVRLREALTEA